MSATAPKVVPITCTVAPVKGSRVDLSVMLPFRLPAMTAMQESESNKTRKRILPKSNLVVIFLCLFLFRCKGEVFL